MAIETGLVQLIQDALDDATIRGGFFAQLPKDEIAIERPQAWTYRVINAQGTYTLAGLDGFVPAEIQIDCHGREADDAVDLAGRIDAAISGFRGTLPDGTFVQGIFNIGHQMDGYNDASRTYVRTLEYQVNFQS